jgi:hypothetical protein
MSKPEEQHESSKNGKPERPWLKRFQFKPGQSGNPGGRPKGSVSIEAELRRRLDNGEEGEKIVKGLVTQALRRALEGDYKFFNMILERVDGRVADRLAGHDGGPLFSDEDMERLHKYAAETDDWRD